MAPICWCLGNGCRRRRGHRHEPRGRLPIARRRRLSSARRGEAGDSLPWADGVDRPARRDAGRRRGMERRPGGRVHSHGGDDFVGEAAGGSGSRRAVTTGQAAGGSSSSPKRSGAAPRRLHETLIPAGPPGGGAGAGVRRVERSSRCVGGWFAGRQGRNLRRRRRPWRDRGGVGCPGHALSQQSGPDLPAIGTACRPGGTNGADRGGGGERSLHGRRNRGEQRYAVLGRSRRGGGPAVALHPGTTGRPGGGGDDPSARSISADRDVMRRSG